MSLGRMKSWGRAIVTFMIGYVVATGVGFASFSKPVLMWTLVFTLMPLVFASLAYWYFRSVKPAPVEARREAIQLALFWIGISFVLDALIYIAVLPLVFGKKANWTFFIDQSPWIWICYAVLASAVFVGVFVYKNTRR
ncbi:MAG: hypothetical protein ACRETC_02560 [Gammaproteobacteria bacterium]